MNTAPTLVQRFAAVIILFLLSSCGGGGGNTAPPPAALQFVKDMRAHALAAAPVSSNASVGPVTATNTAVTADMVLDWAEFKFANLFPKANAQKFPSVVYQGTIYNARAYIGAWGTRYLGITPDGRIFGLGDFTNNALQGFETIAVWAGQVAADRCAVDVSACSPASPLSGRAWSPVVQLASTVSDITLVGIGDDGLAVVVGSTQTPSASFPFVQSTPIVVIGNPGGTGAAQWSSPKALSAFGMRSMAAVPTDLRAVALRVAANGRAVILATGSGGGCPSSQPSIMNICRFVAMFDPALRTWSPWDVMAPLDLSERDDRFTFSVNDRGDLALHFPAGGFNNPTARTFWRSASEVAFRSFALPTDVRGQGPQDSVVTLDEAGGLVVAAGLNQNATTDMAVWRGNVSSGFQGSVVVDTRAAPVSFRSLWTGRSGRSFLMWTQSNGTTDSLFGARFDAASSTLAAEDLGPTVLRTLPTGRVAMVSDSDELIAFRYNGNPAEGSTCATVRWPFVGALELADAPAPCTLALDYIDRLAIERNGNALTIGNDFRWGTYDASLNLQIDGPLDISAGSIGPRSGPGYVTGVQPFSFQIRNRQTVLSRSGIGLVVMSANLDTWPTPASPAGDGRPTVANLWATYLK